MTTDTDKGKDIAQLSRDEAVVYLMDLANLATGLRVAAGILTEKPGKEEMFTFLRALEAYTGVRITKAN